jgi:hypothetical protein
VTYYILGRLFGGFVTIHANCRQHVLVFHDKQLALRCMNAAIGGPDLGPVAMLALPMTSREDAVSWLWSTPEMPADLSILFADDPLFLDLVEDIAHLSRQQRLNDVPSTHTQ